MERASLRSMLARIASARSARAASRRRAKAEARAMPAPYPPGEGMAKLRVGLLFGGRSVEHEVSVTSATCILKALDPTRYDVSLVAIDHQGRWHLGSPALPPEAAASGAEVTLPAVPGEGALVSMPGASSGRQARAPAGRRDLPDRPRAGRRRRLAPGPARARGGAVRRRGRARLRAPDGQGGVQAPARRRGDPRRTVGSGPARGAARRRRGGGRARARRARAPGLREARESRLVGGHHAR